MYRCNDCHTTFELPRTRRVSDYGDVGETVVFDLCPDCGSEEVEEYTPCMKCDEEVIESEYCLVHAKDELDPEEYQDIINALYCARLSKALRETLKGLTP